jgi:hypothetical protein
MVYTGSFSISFQNEHIIYENQILCQVNESDYNLSYNPSLLSIPTNPSSSVKNFATGSDFHPYASMIGLYNDYGDLLMVAKFSQPIPISPYTDTNFIVKLDM